MLSALLPFLVAIIGLVIWFVSTQNAKLAEMGKILFFCGAFITTWVLSSRVIHLG